MNIGFISLGCAKNQVDTEIMMGLVKKAGHSIVNQMERAEVIVVNTCGFITSAQEEAIDSILEIGQLKGHGQLKYLVVTGCLPQRFAADLKTELPEVDAFLGISTYHQLPQAIEQMQQGEKIFWIQPPPLTFIETGPRVLTTPKGYGYLKITDGCNNRCSYCAIPGIRGGLRSDSIEHLIAECAMMARAGCKEIILLGQDTGSYGSDLTGKSNLSKLLVELDQVNDLKWIRVMYLHPNSITRELVNILSQTGKVLPYFDIPVQHISDRILKAMNRKSKGQDIENTLNALREQIPHAVLRTTVMTGFPGETDEEFDELLRFVERMEFDWLGAFAFEPQEGTPAYNLPNHILPEVALSRQAKIFELQQGITRKKNHERLNKKAQILITAKLKEHLYLGRGLFQAPEVDGVTLVKSKQNLRLGDFTEVTLKAIRNYDMIGEVNG